MIVVTFRSGFLIMVGPGQTTIREEENAVSQQPSTYQAYIVLSNIEEEINILQNLSCNSLSRETMLILLALISKQFLIVM